MATMRDSVFVSYRRGDVAAYAGRLAGDLKRRFGNERVFLDVEGIVGGEDFPERIQHALSRSRVVLVVIGENWLFATDRFGRRRIDDPRDWVRQEVKTALQSEGTTVIPVLVEGMKMPPRVAFPRAIAQLAARNAMPLEHLQYRAHADAISARVRDLGIAELEIVQQPVLGDFPESSTSYDAVLEIQKIKRWRLAWQRAVAKAWSQEEYRVRLLNRATTHEALSEVGWDVPDGLEIEVSAAQGINWDPHISRYKIVNRDSGEEVAANGWAYKVDVACRSVVYRKRQLSEALMTRVAVALPPRPSREDGDLDSLALADYEGVSRALPFTACVC